MVPAMIGIEGIRVDIPDPDTPLARWRYNLRESLSYSILVTNPDVMIHDVKKDWTDIQCIEMLGVIQQEHQLVEGTIPACVYAAAINYFTNRALDEGLANNDEVESWGLRPKLPPPEIIRKRKVILLTDSGSLIYRGKKKIKPAKFLNNEAEWSNILAPDVVGGAAWSDWVTYLEKFVTNYSHLMELCPDNVRRFPAHISVIVLDNLNGTNIYDKSQENKKKEEDRHTLKKFLDNCKMTDETDRLMGLLDQFRSALYCQTATAEHWDMPEVVDQIANHLRKKAREKKIATLSSGQFWASIQAFRGKDQLNTSVGAETGSENASGSRPVGDSYAWHHYENGQTPKLPFHWDRYLFRLVCYMETSLLHESIKQSIFDMDNIKEMSTTINKELEEYRQSLERGEDGRIPESIVPNRDQPERVAEADLVEEATGQARRRIRY